MTLRRYTPDELDRLALEMLDVVTQFREMAEMVRENKLDSIELHDKKALDWIRNTKHWTRKSRAQIEVQVNEAMLRRSGQGISSVIDEEGGPGFGSDRPGIPNEKVD